MKYEILILLTTIFGLYENCSFKGKAFCAKRDMNNKRFAYLSGNALAGSYFTINNCIHREFSHEDRLYAESTIKWNNCNEYIMIVNRIYYGEDEGLLPGDTLRVKIQSSQGDTLLCIASAKNLSVNMKLLKYTIKK